jgi:hypothetical protein
MKPVLKSYLRSVSVAVLPLLTIGDDDWKHYLFAVLIAVLAPLARALDSTDEAFGFVGVDELEFDYDEEE